MIRKPLKAQLLLVREIGETKKIERWLRGLGFGEANGELNWELVNYSWSCGFG